MAEDRDEDLDAYRVPLNTATQKAEVVIEALASH